MEVLGGQRLAQDLLQVNELFVRLSLCRESTEITLGEESTIEDQNWIRLRTISVACISLFHKCVTPESDFDKHFTCLNNKKVPKITIISIMKFQSTKLNKIKQIELIKKEISQKSIIYH